MLVLTNFEGNDTYITSPDKITSYRVEFDTGWTSEDAEDDSLADMFVIRLYVNLVGESDGWGHYMYMSSSKFRDKFFYLFNFLNIGNVLCEHYRSIFGLKPSEVLMADVAGRFTSFLDSVSKGMISEDYDPTETKFHLNLEKCFSNAAILSAESGYSKMFFDKLTKVLDTKGVWKHPVTGKTILMKENDLMLVEHAIDMFNKYLTSEI